MPEKVSTGQVPDDPITSQSLSGIYLVAALLLMASLGWALWDEFYGLRPWKSYQRRFVSVYTGYLEKALPAQEAAEKAILESAEYQKLEQQIKDADQKVAAQVAEIDRKVVDINRRVMAVTPLFQTARGKVTALIYSEETASSQRAKAAIQRRIEEAKKGPFRGDLPKLGGGEESVSFTFDQVEAEFNGLKDLKAKLEGERAELLRPANELRKQRDEYVQQRLVGLTPVQMKGLLDKMKAFKIEIKQINVSEAGLVDRCESCHAGIREPATLVKADVGGQAAFVSHPTPELLKIHDPERFGCSPCHGGNGRALDSVERAHGRYEHWLWPLYHRENAEAGCNQCHTADLVVPHGPVLSEGKELFRWKGCMGCHRMEGFDPEPEQLFLTNKTIGSVEKEKQDADRDSARLAEQGDKASDNQTAQVLYQKAENLRVSVSRMDSHLAQLDLQARNLMLSMKKVGPDLKEVRVKMHKEWIPVWLENPRGFRPTTKMPRFRLASEDRQAIAAYIWQSGIEATLPSQPPGDPAKGKESFETRGCMACHSIGEGAQQQGGTFAANLTRVGEKDTYDYLVRWIHNPRERTRPYCSYEKRDIPPEDYAKKGLPYVFDLDHSKCPNDGHQLQVEQMTVMPSLRLSWEEARNIASYLMSLKTKEPSAYPPAPYLDDPKLKQTGLALVRFYGCAGCHEISGFEEEGRVGTELTEEGSKPIERLDFALLMEKAQHEGWFNHKGFFEHKLENPAVYDQGKEKAPLERLKMPDFSLEAREVNALTTFLLGTVVPTIPQQLYYHPADRRRDIQEGWWIVKKYNCQGCHVVEIGQSSVLMGLARYQTPDWKEQLPPRLTSEGARVDPEWLVRFLKNPALNETDTDRNGVRPYLHARMPTFFFSDEEVRKLVRFFMAVSYQPEPYIRARLDPLAAQEQTMARQLFTSTAAPCLKCHATGNAAHDVNATAPNFLLAKDRLKPDWTGRWMVDPARISPGTSMPTGLFRREGSRWVFAGPTPPSFQGYSGDHVDLLVRYMFQFTPEEQRRLGAGVSAGAAQTGARGRVSGTRGR